MKRRKKLYELLRKKNLSAFKLAKELGYSNETTVYKWLYGKGSPNALTMLRLTVILGVSAEEILEIFAEEATDL